VSKYRTRALAQNVIAISISYQRDNLLSRGMGLDHLKELLVRIARPILRQGASLAYGGNWKERDDNFTYELLRLVAAEQEDNSFTGEEAALTIGKVYNHLAWPHYLEVTPRIEAQWINSCRIVRVTQQDAGIAAEDIVPDADARDAAQEPRAIYNSAVTLSAMRRSMMVDSVQPIPGLQRSDIVPAVVARILLGGKMSDYTGFVPGVFEELLVTFAAERPIYLLGGFGGAAEVLADAILETGVDRPDQFTEEWHVSHNPRLGELLNSAAAFAAPPNVRSTRLLLDALFAFVLAARVNPAQALRTGLDDSETRELLRTRDLNRAVSLIKTGLERTKKLPQLPA
jgi:hypothetical protein